jgi:hypothetical protein
MKDDCTMSFRRSYDDTEVIIRRLLYNQIQMKGDQKMIVRLSLEDHEMTQS